ncbi:MAG: acetylesterase [Lachnospiraceae bacterium]|jgi:putative tributyrin esterase|nr:acetylesterase [Lachnospiraceae bacterium]
MALIEVNFISKALLRTVSFRAILPLDKIPLDRKGTEAEKEKKTFKTLYLLHGGYGNDTDYISGTRIQRWAEERNLAVIMPAGENHFYLDQEDTQEYYGQFVGKELVEFTRQLFPLSEKREDTFIAGLSMGGYGALVNGLKYADTFGAIGLFSAGVILEDILEETDFIRRVGWKRPFWERVFGPKEALRGSDRDYYALLRKLQEEKKEIPQIFIAIGTSDSLYKRNQEFKQFLEEQQVSFTYREDEGGHEWDFWDRYIKEFLEWLPLEAKWQGLNSGNVRK